MVSFVTYILHKKMEEKNGKMLSKDVEKIRLETENWGSCSDCQIL